MGIDDKIKHEAKDLKGKAKETYGDVTDNERMEAEGKAEQVEAELGKSKDHLKDAVNE